MSVDWPTWDQAAIAALASWALALALTRWRPTSRLTAAIAPAGREFALVAGLYSLWRVARQLPLTHENGAIERARQINDWQQRFHLPTELSLQNFVQRHDWLAQAASTYYATVHVPALLIFLVWLFVRHRDVYPRWRNALVILTAFCLFIRFVRVAPPRFLSDLGYVDLSSRYGFDIYGPIGEGVSDQFAAMPSIHVAWAAVVSFGVVAASTSLLRWILGLHVVITMLVVAATGNHWWLDGIVAIGLLLVALGIDATARAWWTSREPAGADAPAEPRSTGADVPAALDVPAATTDAESSHLGQGRLGCEQGGDLGEDPGGPVHADVAAGSEGVRDGDGQVL